MYLTGDVSPEAWDYLKAASAVGALVLIGLCPALLIRFGVFVYKQVTRRTQGNGHTRRLTELRK